MKNTAPDSIRETLFGDCPLDQWPPDGAAEEYFPWSAFVLARSQFATGRQSDAFTLWRAVVQHAELEPRQYLQAWHFLRQRGLRPPPHQAKQVLGVIVEVAMAQDLDLLAAYPDHSARYYNYSGAGVVWEHPDQSLDSAIDHLVEASKQVVAKIGPGEEERAGATASKFSAFIFSHTERSTFRTRTDGCAFKRSVVWAGRSFRLTLDESVDREDKMTPDMQLQRPVTVPGKCSARPGQRRLADASYRL